MEKKKRRTMNIMDANFNKCIFCSKAIFFFMTQKCMIPESKFNQ